MSGLQSLRNRLRQFLDLTHLEALYFGLVLALCAFAAARGLRADDPFMLVTAAALLGGLIVWRTARHSSPEAVLGKNKSSVAVDLSAYAPRQVKAGEDFILTVWAYQPCDQAEVRKRAMGKGGKIIGEKAGAEFPERGYITVRLEIASLEVAVKEDSFYWTGIPASACFPVKVPQNTKEGNHLGRAMILVNGIPAATLHLEVTVGKSADNELLQAGLRIEPVKEVFASYSVKDMYEVLGRLQGLRVFNPDANIFLDVYSLKQGENFTDRILNEVKKRDTFLLFWSRNAAASAWVDLEWRTALEKETGSIIPVPLEPASQAPPPPELADRNFNDCYSYHAHMLKELDRLQEELAAAVAAKTA